MKGVRAVTHNCLAEGKPLMFIEHWSQCIHVMLDATLVCACTWIYRLQARDLQGTKTCRSFQGSTFTFGVAYTCALAK